MMDPMFPLKPTKRNKKMSNKNSTKFRANFHVNIHHSGLYFVYAAERTTTLDKNARKRWLKQLSCTVYADMMFIFS